jgi:ubiquinone/menaquinone biosynthesis C-methylase UbiE
MSSPLANDAYAQLADGYAARIDTKPHNAYYERPATQSLLPDVQGRRVLDAGCGTGVYTEWLLAGGATVVGFDASPHMLAHARRRVGDRATLFEADLGAPLTMLADASFDVVVCPLVLEYVEDWRRALRELHRVLQPGGTLVASVTHPAFDATLYSDVRYFEVQRVEGEWGGFTLQRVTVPTYRRSLEETLNPFLDAGFRLDRLLEPRPTDDFRRADPRHFAELSAAPCFLCIRASAQG